MTDEELIRKVAEEVMGWDILNNKMTDGPYLFHGRTYLKRIAWELTIEWNPLTNLNHAFMVVERMRELGWQFDITTDSIDWDCNPHEKEIAVVFYDFKQMMAGTEPKFYNACHKDLGHAICMAALKAVENG